MIPQKLLATKDGIRLHLRFTWNIWHHLAKRQSGSLDHSESWILTANPARGSTIRSQTAPHLSESISVVALLGDLGALAVAWLFSEWRTGSCNLEKLSPGRRPEKSLTDAETGENLPEQVIGGEFAGYAGKRALSKPEFLGKQFKLGNADGRLVNVGLRRLQRLQVTLAGHEKPLATAAPPDRVQHRVAQ